MGQWARQELDEAFERQQQVVAEIGQSWDWSRYADMFTEDATYVEHAMGNLSDASRSGTGSCRP